MALYLDRSLTFLNDLGYNVLRRPGASPRPLDVLGRDDVLERLGPLSTVFAMDVPPLRPGSSEPAMVLNGRMTDAIHISLGLGRLAAFINGLGAAVAAADLAGPLREARFLNFIFEAATITRVDTYEMLRAMSVAQLTATPPAPYFVDPRTDAFVVTEVVELEALGLMALDIGSARVDVDLPAMQACVGDAVKVSVVNDRLIFRGQAPATIAFKCYRLERGRSAQAFTIDTGRGDTGVAVLFAPGTMVQVL